MDRESRAVIERATQSARRLLEADFAAQLQGTFDVQLSGTVAPVGGPHLSDEERRQRRKIVAAIEHKLSLGVQAGEAVTEYVRDAAFTVLNRFVALKMLESRDLVQECISRGEQSAGYREFCGMAPGLAVLPLSIGYRLYIDCLFDELSTEVKVLFDARDPSAALWPRRPAFEELLTTLNAAELVGLWDDDETIGWVYQYFTSQDERRGMRGASPVPRSSYELAARNQFFTPRYVVEFLIDNTLGLLWYEMLQGQTALTDKCVYLRRPELGTVEKRPRRDPRDLAVLDPACGSGHFLLYAFDLLLVIYEEAWSAAGDVESEVTGRTLREDFPSLDDLRLEVPHLILRFNLHGVEIDRRCSQIAQLALWMRAQRVFRDQGVERGKRPPIARTNVVVAEPMPGERDLQIAFLQGLEEEGLRKRFQDLVDHMDLAGELGLLLQLDTLLTSAPVGTTGDLFTPTIESLREAISRFAATASAADDTQRRLFRDDAVQGVGLLELSEKRFDVIVMNPPFGEATERTQSYLAKAVPEGANDIYAAMVARACDCLTEGGLLGAITSRAFMVGRDLRRFRRLLLAERGPRLTLLADLGGGVLDRALVETAAYIVSDGADELCVFDARQDDDKAQTLREAVARDGFRCIALDRFRAAPQRQILYGLSEADTTQLSDGRATVEPFVGRVTKGLSTGADDRFVRLLWELPPDVRSRGWQLFSKGGDYSWFAADVHLLVNRKREGLELAAFAERGDGNVARTKQSSSYYGRPALTWSRRSQKGFSVRRLREGAAFSDKSPVIVPSQDEADWIGTLLGLLATEEYLTLIYAQSKFGSYETGAVKVLPAPKQPMPNVARAIERVCEALDGLSMHDERTQLFVEPLELIGRLPDAAFSELVDDLSSALAETGYTLSQEARSGLEEGWAQRIAELSQPHLQLSYALGFAYGRWKPVEKPGRPGFIDALGASAPAARELPDDPLAEWLVDDPGGRRDVTRSVCEALPGARYDDGETRERMRRSFFDEHVAFHSRSARVAPIYWQLATPDRGFSAWLFFLASSPDSMWRMLNELVLPKLDHEERQLEALLREGGGEARRQQGQVEQLRAFAEEVKRVAPLWRPAFDDGVVVTAAPLWRLFPHQRQWQSRLLKVWTALQAGEVDWSRTAMHLWPERVVPKCAEDRSIAIAHQLDGVFWEQQADGKWRQLASPLRPQEELIAERSSPAVKAALDSLLSAPPGVPARGRSRAKVRHGRA